MVNMGLYNVREELKTIQSNLNRYIPNSSQLNLIAFNQSFTIMKCFGIEKANEFYKKMIKENKERQEKGLSIFG